MAIASIIQTLVAHDVEFVVVGGMAAVLQGAPVHTIDLDIVYALSESNIARLDLALTELGAVFRDDLPPPDLPWRKAESARRSARPGRAR
jgi:hypothetical protein